MKNLILVLALLFQITFNSPRTATPMASLAEIQQLVQQMHDELPGLIAKIKIVPPQILTAAGLSDISKQLGLFQAGEFRVGNSIEPGFGFSGTRIGYPPFSYNSLLWNIAGVNNDTLQFGLNAADGTAWAGGGAVRLTSGGILIYNGAIQTGSIETDGDVRFGSNLSAAATTSFQVITNDQTVNGEALGAGDVLIGDNSSGKPNLFWDKSAGQLSMRLGTIVQAYASGSSSFAQIGASVTSGAVSLTSGAVTAISFNAEVFDDAAFWDAGSPTRITIPYTGVYQFTWRSQFTASAVGQRFSYVDVNAGGVSLQHCVDGTGGAKNTLYTDTVSLSLTAGDYVEFKLMQDSGGTLNGQINLSVIRVK